MLPVSHHIPEDILAAYAAGSLPHAFSVVVAAHISLCDECRATLEAVDALGGALLESRELAENIAPISPDFRSRTLAAHPV